MNYLIIGAGGAAGQSAVAAVRKFDAGAHVIGTTSGNGSPPGVNDVITGVDLNDPESPNHMHRHLGTLKISALFFTPALGPLGYPVKSAPPEDVKKCLAFCLTPMQAMHGLVKPDLSVGYSAFYWLKHALGFYGSMAHAKLAMERWAVETPNVKMIRAGTFRSVSTRGISIILQRQMKKSDDAAMLDMAAGWKLSGKKFSDFFFEYVWQHEAAAFSKRFASLHRATTENDLTEAALLILRGQKERFVNVIGGWNWVEDEIPELPSDFSR